MAPVDRYWELASRGLPRVTALVEVVGRPGTGMTSRRRWAAGAAAVAAAGGEAGMPAGAVMGPGAAAAADALVAGAAGSVTSGAGGAGCDTAADGCLAVPWIAACACSTGMKGVPAPAQSSGTHG